MPEDRQVAESETASDFRFLVDSYIEDFCSRRPSLAALGGLHDWDDCLEDFSQEGIEDECRALAATINKLERLNAADLKVDDRIDFSLLKNNARARLHELEAVRSWERNPQIYGDVVAAGLLYLIMFDDYSESDKIRAITRKLSQVPRLIESAVSNVVNPAAVFVKHGIASMSGALTLVERSLAGTYSHINGDARREYLAATESATAAMRRYLSYLQDGLARRATGDFRVGQEHFETKLLYEDGVSTSAETLLRIGMEVLAETQAAFEETAATIDRSANPSDVWSRLRQNHPRAGELVPTAQGQLDELARFIEEHKIVSLCQTESVRVGLTPDFFQWTFASLWPSGVLEQREFRARYLVTDVRPEWSDEEKKQHLSYFAYPVLWIISMHEAFPGHAVQFSHLSNVRSKLRRFLGIAPASFVEGWAHYTEQMMIEEGFGDGDPGIKLGQLSQSLIRLCRLITSIRMHADAMTIDEAARFFRENAYCADKPARTEAERGTFDPTYLNYSYGRMEILKLRDDCRKSRANRFSLREFHDDLLGIGMAPLWVHRHLMLGEPSPDGETDQASQA